MKLFFEHVGLNYFGIKSTTRGNRFYSRVGRNGSSVEEHHLIRAINEGNLGDYRIRRIFPLERFRELIEDGKMALISPNKWAEDDAFENYVFNSKIKNTDTNTYEFSPYKDQFYAQCWTYGYENDAMWKLYSGDQNGIMVETTIDKLCDLINTQISVNAEDFALGRVAYLHKEDLNELIKEHEGGIRAKAFGDDTVVGAIITLLIKLYAYNHEKEIRLVYHNNDSKVENFKNGILLSGFNPKDLITRVTIDPRVEEQVGLDLKNEFSKVIDHNKLFHSNLKKRKPILI